MAFLIISKSCLDGLTERQFFLKKKLFPPAVFSVFPARVPIYLNESELTNVK